MKNRPSSHEYGAYYANYISQVKDDDILAVLKKSKSDTVHFLKALPSEKWDYAYAPGKWTIKELMIHLIDGERIFAYRALRIARGDKTPLPGFEQEDYVPMSNAQQRSPASVIAEYEAVREATLQLFENLSDEAWKHIGEASKHPASPLALAFIIAGHELHHLKAVRERYL